MVILFDEGEEFLGDGPLHENLGVGFHELLNGVVDGVLGVLQLRVGEAQPIQAEDVDGEYAEVPLQVVGHFLDVQRQLGQPRVLQDLCHVTSTGCRMMISS